jgi:SAM-dependent methyltransferase
MVSLQRWEEAQESERSFWQGVTKDEAILLKVLWSQAAQAAQLRRLLPSCPRTCLEIGIGPLGVGISGFLEEIPFRWGVDPLGPVQPQCTDALRAFIGSLQIPYLVGRGEFLPVASGTVDLVLCSNVLDHVLNAGAILAEIRRVLKPRGYLFLKVGTFSLLGLLKWHTWTKHRHREELIVKCHPYHFPEWTVQAMLKAQGLEVLAKEGHSRLSLILGHALDTAFFAVKR